MLGKELELVRTAQEKNSQEFEKVEVNHRVLEKKLKGKNWELEDLKGMKDAMYGNNFLRSKCNHFQPKTFEIVVL